MIPIKIHYSRQFILTQVLCAWFTRSHSSFSLRKQFSNCLVLRLVDSHRKCFHITRPTVGQFRHGQRVCAAGVKTDLCGATRSRHVMARIATHRMAAETDVNGPVFADGLRTPFSRLNRESIVTAADLQSVAQLSIIALMRTSKHAATSSQQLARNRKKNAAAAAAATTARR